jgi:hypothetical protein
VTGGAFLEFDGDADRTLFENGIMVLKARDTTNMIMGAVQVAIAWVAKTLMPK